MFALVIVLVAVVVGLVLPATDRRERIAFSLSVAGVMLPIAIISEVAIRDAQGDAALWPVALALVLALVSPAFGLLYLRHFKLRGTAIRAIAAAFAGAIVLTVHAGPSGLDGLGDALARLAVAALIAFGGYIAGAIIDITALGRATDGR